MKVQLETISEPSKSPFRLLHDPRLNNLFYWHFHPEFELVYINGASATRHVGNHISNYKNSDLVLIGSNIPHLNFDYGVNTTYRHEVLHIKPEFKKKVLDEYPELEKIKKLLQMSQYGIAFGKATIQSVGQTIENWNATGRFEFFTSVLTVLDMLAVSTDFELLHKSPFINRFKQRNQKRLRLIHAFLEEHYARKISLDEIADKCSLGKEAFCRYFKKETGSTFFTFLNQYRISQAKSMLLSGHSISDSCFSCGFESLSYFNRVFKTVEQENPSDFKKRQTLN